MRNKTLAKLLRPAFLVLIVAVLLFGVLAAPQAQAASYKASGITLRDDLAHDYKQYLDSSKMYPLPESVRDDQTISVIITVDAPNLMDAYDATDKTQSFSDFARTCDQAAEIAQTISTEKARILGKLDELQVSYATGKDYSVLLSGFEIEITARDFEVVCQSLGKGEGTIVSEV